MPATIRHELEVAWKPALTTYWVQPIYFFVLQKNMLPDTL